MAGILLVIAVTALLDVLRAVLPLELIDPVYGPVVFGRSFSVVAVSLYLITLITCLVLYGISVFRLHKEKVTITRIPLNNPAAARAAAARLTQIAKHNREAARGEVRHYRHRWFIIQALPAFLLVGLFVVAGFLTSAPSDAARFTIGEGGARSHSLSRAPQLYRTVTVNHNDGGFAVRSKGDKHSIWGIQAFYVDPDTQDTYVVADSQYLDKEGKFYDTWEHLYLLHYDKNGQYIDGAKYTNGGHGQRGVIFKYQGELYLLSPHATNSSRNKMAISLYKFSSRSVVTTYTVYDTDASPTVVARGNYIGYIYGDGSGNYTGFRIYDMDSIVKGEKNAFAASKALSVAKITGLDNKSKCGKNDGKGGDQYSIQGVTWTGNYLYAVYGYPGTDTSICEYALLGTTFKYSAISEAKLYNRDVQEPEYLMSTTIDGTERLLYGHARSSASAITLTIDYIAN